MIDSCETVHLEKYKLCGASRRLFQHRQPGRPAGQLCGGSPHHRDAVHGLLLHTAVDKYDHSQTHISNVPPV